MPRKKIDINWDLVEKRMEAGCNGVEIAATLRIDSDTFYNRFREKYGKRFQDSSADFYKAGDANLKSVQYSKALSGNMQMLIFLGKERLGQGKEELINSPFEDILALKHENMILRAELTDIKEKLNADKS